MSINIIKNIFSNSEPCIYMRNVDTNEIWTNKSFFNMIGYISDELSKMNIDDICVNCDKASIYSTNTIKIRLKNHNIVNSRWETHSIENQEVILIQIHKINDDILHMHHNEIRNHLNGIMGFSNILIHDKSNIDEYIMHIIKCSQLISVSIDNLQSDTMAKHKSTDDTSPMYQTETNDLSDSSDKLVTVLHIEDNAVTVELTKAMLNNFSENINYRCAYTGEKGLDLIRELKPDILLLDINLPDISGRYIYNIAKKEGLLKGKHVIFISALDDDAQTGDKSAPETEHYFRKPINGYQFCKLLNSTIESIYNKYYE